MDENVYNGTWHTDSPNFLLAQKWCLARCCDSVVPLPTGGQGTDLSRTVGHSQSRNTAQKLSFALVSPSAHMAVVGTHRMSAGGFLHSSDCDLKSDKFLFEAHCDGSIIYRL